MSDPLADLAKVIAPGDGISPTQPDAPHRWTRGVIDTLNGDGTANVFLDGGTVSVLATVLSPQLFPVGSIVEVLVAGTRVIVWGPANDGSPAVQMIALGATPSLMFGSAPPSGTPIATYVASWTGNTLLFGISFVNIDITSLGLTHGYNVVPGIGDAAAAGTPVQSAVVPGNCTLTQLQIQVATAAGANLAAGSHIRVNFVLSGA